MINPKDNNEILIQRLSKGDEAAFDLIFNHFYAGLCSYANYFIQDIASSEEITQDVFVKFWEDRNKYKSDTFNLKAYLLTCVRNKCYDFLKHKSVMEKYRNEATEKLNLLGDDTYDAYFEMELRQKLDDALSKLPQNTREIFEMNRFDGLKYQEIAQKQGVSVKTVEAHMTKTLKFLRVELKDLLGILVLYI